MIEEFLDHLPLRNSSKRLQQQLAFIIELDKLKSVLRRASLLSETRKENTAEHSWHLAMMAIVLSEYAAPEVNINRVIRMVLVHDIVEIDAGDTYLYEDSSFANSKAEREKAAADRIFNLLPSDLGSETRALWEEFEARQTPDAKFAAAIDRLEPILYNYFSKGQSSWQHSPATVKKVTDRAHIIQDASKALGDFVFNLIQDAEQREYLKV